MKTMFAYGKTGIEVEIPGKFACAVVEARFNRPVADAGAAICSALDYPIGATSIGALAGGKSRVAIVVCDITRPAPNRVTLPPLLKRLHAAGIVRENITILIATGLHRAATEEETRFILGEEVASIYRVVNNDARAEGQHSFLGETSRGTPVWIHNDFVNADLRITLGFIEPHLMAGFSGGRKLVAPGVARQETIKSIHSPKFMRSPLAVEGSVSENPLHAELLEIARMGRHDFIVDVTLTRDRHISGVFAGEPRAAHAAGIRFLTESCMEVTPNAADLVVTSAAGFPLDLTFYQSVKAITAAQRLARPGARILVISECAEGVGSEEFAHALRTMSSFNSYLSQTATTPVVVDQWQLDKLAMAGLRNDLRFCLPGVRAESLGFLASRHSRSIGEAISSALEGLPETRGSSCCRMGRTRLLA